MFVCGVQSLSSRKLFHNTVCVSTAHALAWCTHLYMSQLLTFVTPSQGGNIQLYRVVCYVYLLCCVYVCVFMCVCVTEFCFWHRQKVLIHRTLVRAMYVFLYVVYLCVCNRPVTIGGHHRWQRASCAPVTIGHHRWQRASCVRCVRSCEECVCVCVCVDAMRVWVKVLVQTHKCTSMWRVCVCVWMRCMFEPRY